MKRACVFMANGTEECEALLTVDILRRAGVEVVTASVNQKPEILSSHNVRMDTDAVAADIQAADFDLIVLPGGMPGTINLKENEFVKAVCQQAATAGKLVAAICAAPSALAAFGLLEGKKATAYPSFTDQLAGAPWSRSLWWRTATSSPAGAWARLSPSLWRWCGGSAARMPPKRCVRPLVTPTASDCSIRLFGRASHTARAFSSLGLFFAALSARLCINYLMAPALFPASEKEVCP